MISLVKDCVFPDQKSIELVKIKCTFESYRDIALFWVQNDSDCFISMLDGNMVIYNVSADFTELKSFIRMIGPHSIFTDKVTADNLGLKDYKTVSVMEKCSDENSDVLSDVLSSDEIYNLLNVKGLALPPYEYFAVDYCHRLNGGKADCFGIKNICASISFNCENYAFINGIASRKKGMGSVALKGIMSKNKGRTVFACCERETEPFYLKNGFKFCYNAVYWVRE
ncbi:MAG: hypothetical protein MJ076_02005 [Clostridia bacterium]|nr:hypothetical protein [Clostridia bacterium]